MLVYGKNSCYEVLQKENLVKKIYLKENFNDKNIISLIEKKKFQFQVCSKMQLDELVDGLHQGIIVDVRDYEYTDLDELIKENGFLVILDHLEDPHNFGAIIRTCEAANVDGIIIPKDRSVMVNSTVVKTSAGAVYNTKIALVTNLANTIKYLKEKNYWIVATDMSSQSYTDVDYKDNICLVIGNEGKGVSELVKKLSDYVVSIPMIGKVNSLNASVATGIMIYEVIRQRSI